MSSPVTPRPPSPGPVESGVEVEIAESRQAQDRPGLAHTALALARMLDNPRAVSAQPAATRQLTVILDRLARSSHRRAKLAVVKSMTEKGGALMPDGN